MLVASGLQKPTYITTPPKDLDRMFVVEQAGYIRIVKNGSVLSTPFLDIDAKVGCCGPTGFLGMAFHPRYESNGYFYVNYTTSSLANFRTIVARYTVSSTDPDIADPASEQIVLSIPQPYTTHNGGMMAFGPDGYLYIGMGDGGFPTGGGGDPHNHGQRLDTLLGKILRIDVDGGVPYAIPPSNPFVGQAGALDEIWAYGIRQPWRFSFDRQTGDLYIGEVGPTREEIDFEPAGSPGGRNYGWRCMAGTQCTGKPGCICPNPAFTDPIHDYDPAGGCRAVIGGYVYRGCAIPSLRGTYIFADYCMRKIWSFRYDGSTVSQFVERFAELAPGGGLDITRITSFGEDAQGELYLCDYVDGELYKIVPSVPATAGLTPFGVGTPGCSGAHSLGGSCSPVVGNKLFALTCDNAPPLSLGILVLSLQPDITGSDPFGVGLTLHVQLGPATLLTLPYFSDPSGNASLQIPIPGNPAFVGAAIHEQAFWAWPTGPCTPSLWAMSSSNGLTMTIQP